MPAKHDQVLNDRPERQRREEGERPYDDDNADQHRHEQGRVGREGAQTDRHFLLGDQCASDGEHRAQMAQTVSRLFLRQSPRNPAADDAS